MSTDIPEDLYYSKDHEWARVDDKIATVGITRYAVEQLGDITMVDLPKEGDRLTQGQTFGSVESVKAVSDLYAPVSGRVIKVNDPLADSPEFINEEPYDEGWMLQIELSDAKELENLMSGAAYSEFLKETEAE